MTGMVTRAVAGVTSIGMSALPSLSTGTSRTSSSTSIPADWIATSARTESTCETSDADPETVTVSGSTVTLPSVSPSGTGPWTTLTGTSARDTRLSSSTVANCGWKPRIVTRESGLVTLIGTWKTPTLPSYPARSMVARNELAATRTPLGAK